MASKNKRLGRLTETKVVKWLADLFGLVILVKNKKGSNFRTAQIARAEEVSQLLDNQGVDIWFAEDTGINIKIQVKRTLVRGDKSKAIDIQPLFDNDVDVLFTEVRIRANKNQMHYNDVVSVRVEFFEKLIKTYYDRTRV